MQTQKDRNTLHLANTVAIIMRPFVKSVTQQRILLVKIRGRGYSKRKLEEGFGLTLQISKNNY